METIAQVVGYGFMAICLILGAVMLVTTLIAKYGDVFLLKSQLNKRLMKDDEMFEKYVQMLRDLRKQKDKK